MSAKYMMRRRMQKGTGRRNNKKKSLGRRIGMWMFFGVIFFIFVGIVAAVSVFWYYAKDLPAASEISARRVVESTKIYDRTGHVLLYDIHGEEKRTVISFEEMPTVVRYATLALEDQDFYNHHGIKLTAIIRGALSQVFPGRFGGRSSGGSTITQQLLKNTLLTSERSLDRKIREAILSLELERKFEKDEILAMYLNEIPYGSNAYGIEAAAKTFFDKHARDLTIDEAALLAALPQQPSRYSPYGSYPERLVSRQHYAIDQMVSLGYITRERADDAKKIDTLAKLAKNSEKINAPHFVMYVREYLDENYDKEVIEEGGLKVYTTLDYDMQQRAERIVREGVENNEKYDATNASLVAIDPKNSQVVAMVGSVDFFNKDIDGQVNVALRFRQPGSSFKPFVYLEMFRRGYTPETVLYDVPTKFDDGVEPYAPQNYDGSFRGPVKLKNAIGMSLNIPAVKALYLIGVNEAVALGKKLGLTGLDNPRRYGLSLVLGGGEVQLLHHTHAYATLANSGVRNDLVNILRVEDKHGKILEKYEEKDGEEVIEKEHVTTLSNILSNNKYRAPAFGARNALRFDERQVAAKTGTTNEYRDAWTMGYTPSLAVGVWVGNNDNHAMRNGAAGGVVAGPIWHAFMEESLNGTILEHFGDFEEDDNDSDSDEEEVSDKDERMLLDGKVPELEEEKVCRISKKKNLWCLKSDACDDNDIDIKRRKFINAHSILHYVNKNDPRGDKPKRPKNDSQYKAWEKGIQTWYEKSDDKIVFALVPEDKCEDKDFD